MQERVKILKNPEISELAGEKVMIDFDSGNYFMLKGPANDIWTLLKDGITEEEITNALMQEYSVSREDCKAGVVEFLTLLKEKGFIILE